MRVADRRLVGRRSKESQTAQSYAGYRMLSIENIEMRSPL
jgi:hypothetical protein